MEPMGWVIFLISNAAVIALVVFCFSRVLSVDSEHMHPTVEIDTHDLNDNDNENGDAPLNPNN